MGTKLREACVTMYCNGDVKERFVKWPLACIHLCFSHFLLHRLSCLGASGAKQTDCLPEAPKARFSLYKEKFASTDMALKITENHGKSWKNHGNFFLSKSRKCKKPWVQCYSKPRLAVRVRDSLAESKPSKLH